MNIKVEDYVNDLYWNHDLNCARTMLVCLSKIFDTPVGTQTMDAAIGLHGAGGFRAQCGLVEGGLMFIGLYFSTRGKSEEAIVSLCYQFAEEFNRKFGSLLCYDLRPDGFQKNDPPHLCENLTASAVGFAQSFIQKADSLF